MNNSQQHRKIQTIALGSDRAAKIMAVRSSIARVATIDPAWAQVKLVARPVEITAPAMPLTDWELMKGARERALAVCELLKRQRLEADLYVGLEGGFHSISVDGEWHTFLRGWAYVTDGEIRGSSESTTQVLHERATHSVTGEGSGGATNSSQHVVSDHPVDGPDETGSGRERGFFGATPSISVPESIRKTVIEGRRELGLVIDEVAGARDVRSRQGAWGILSRDLVTRSLSFELALIAAFAPFYNPALYA